ncbi:hypothetical protein Lesp02_38430 [Lentzea sp. NBRC 105346]|nr:lasso RiPP family leader peptide-containing protein [Lentzea sp. NBRC 105346]GLZ31655.1 hypothetical protein Lesp02_38430 [Lentzea sp. NBRC 105346]
MEQLEPTVYEPPMMVEAGEFAEQTHGNGWLFTDAGAGIAKF